MLRRLINCIIIIIIIWPTSTKPQAWKIKLSKNNDHDGRTGYHMTSNVATKATAFPLWRAIDKRWNRNEHRLSCVLRDCSDASTNFLHQLYGRLVIIIIIIIIIVILSIYRMAYINLTVGRILVPVYCATEFDGFSTCVSDFMSLAISLLANIN